MGFDGNAQNQRLHRLADCTSATLLTTCCAVQTIDPDDANGEDDEDDDAQYYAVGDKTLRISTAHTEEKNNALNMLACYAEHLQARTMPVDCVVLERFVKRCPQHVCPPHRSTWQACCCFDVGLQGVADAYFGGCLQMCAAPGDLVVTRIAHSL